MRISDWSSDGYSSELNDDAGYRSRDLRRAVCRAISDDDYLQLFRRQALRPDSVETAANRGAAVPDSDDNAYQRVMYWGHIRCSANHFIVVKQWFRVSHLDGQAFEAAGRTRRWRSWRSEEHTSELQSLMRISYAVFCLKKIYTSCSSIIFIF